MDSMDCRILYIACLVTMICGIGCLASPDADDVTSAIVRWTEAAYARVQSVNCADDESSATSTNIFTWDSHQDCRRLQAVLSDDGGKRNVIVYVAGHPADGHWNGVHVHHQTDVNMRNESSSSSSRRLRAVLPDGVLEGVASKVGHDAVLVLDPYPTASFGHLVLVFFIDYGWNSLQCRLAGGTYLIENGECLSIATKHRCHNALERSNTGTAKQFARRCDIHFLPLVHFVHLPAHQDDQLLECKSIPGFVRCPQLRSVNETRHMVCNPLHANTHRCHDVATTDKDISSQALVHGPQQCRPFETCDHAILIGGGGWSREHSNSRMALNVRHLFQMLRHNGFHRKNIKVFYANGARGVQLVGENTHFVYPSALKLALRHHLQKVCRSTLCADSFVVYLNNPTRSDGGMLLWDVDGNGQADDNEVYRVGEILEDLGNCSANQVYVLVDQSFAGELVKAFDGSDRHSNVVIMGSGRDAEYSFDGEFTRHWASVRNHSTCVTEVHQLSHTAIKRSHPTMNDGSDDTLRTTIFGAPCDVRPVFSQRELRQKYLGCQNVPTKVWINKHSIIT